MTKDEMKQLAKPNHTPRKRKRVPQDTTAPLKAGRKVLRTSAEDLPVPLSKKELRETGAQLAAKLEDITRHTAYEKEVKASLKARRTELESTVAAIGLRLRSGTKLESIRVNDEADFGEGVVLSIRTDTGETIRTRPLRTEERQDALPLEPQTAEEVQAIMRTQGMTDAEKAEAKTCKVCRFQADNYTQLSVHMKMVHPEPELGVGENAVVDPEDEGIVAALLPEGAAPLEADEEDPDL